MSNSYNGFNTGTLSLILFILVVLGSAPLITGDDGNNVYAVSFEGRLVLYNTTPTTYNSQIPYYWQVGIPDYFLFYPSIGLIKYEIMYSLNLYNDTPIIMLGNGFLVLTTLIGINDTHSTFIVYLVDPSSNRVISRIDLSNYSVVFPKIFYNNYRVHYHIYRLGEKEVVISAYVFDDEKWGELIVINPFQQNPIIGEKKIPGLLYYKYFNNKGYAVTVQSLNETRLAISSSKDPLLNTNVTITINTSLDNNLIIPLLTTATITNNVIHLLIPYYQYIGFKYNATIAIVDLGINPYKLLGYSIVNIGAHGVTTKYTYPHSIDGEILEPYIPGLLAYNTTNREGAFYVLNNGFEENYSIIIPLYRYVYVVISKTVNQQYVGALPWLLRIYSLEDFNKSYMDVYLDLPSDRLYDTSNVIIDYLGNNVTSLTIPYYKLINQTDKLIVGLEIALVDTNNQTIKELYDIPLTSINLPLIPQLRTTFEIETYQYDVNNDGFKDYVVVLSYWMTNNTAVQEVYVASPNTNKLLEALPEPPTTPLILLMIIIFLISDHNLRRHGHDKY